MKDGSNSAALSSGSQLSDTPRSPKPDGKRDSRTGRYISYGRHSNDWLFGGVDVSDKFKNFFTSIRDKVSPRR
jgi:hypothetical protein